MYGHAPHRHALSASLKEGGVGKCGGSQTGKLMNMFLKQAKMRARKDKRKRKAENTHTRVAPCWPLPPPVGAPARPRLAVLGGGTRTTRGGAAEPWREGGYQHP